MAGRSLLVMGPSGSGKSSLLRNALQVEGGGAILMAPGDDEAASYEAYKGKDRHLIVGFDDPEFQPLIGLKKVEGLANAMRYGNALLRQTKEDYEAQRPLKYPLIGVDRIDGFGQLAINVALKRVNMDTAPPAQSKDGAEYYMTITNVLNQFLRPLRACKGYGAHLIITAHVVEREVKKTSMAGVVGGVAEVVNIPGSAFREAIPGMCDFTLYAGIAAKGILKDGKNDPTNPRHYLQWLPDPDRPTKSRLGSLSTQALIPNEWAVLKPLIDAAAEARNAEAA